MIEGFFHIWKNPFIVKYDKVIYPNEVLYINIVFI